MFNRRGISLAVLLFAAQFSLAQEATQPDFSGYLLGDWAHSRQTMASHGWFTQAGVTADYMRHSSRGFNDGQSAAIALVALQANLDTGDAGWWGNGLFHAQLQVVSGENPVNTVGDFQSSDNIGAPTGVRLYEAWYQHEWQEGHTSMLFGVHDAATEFQVLGSSALFLNSSQAVSPELMQVAPSIYPQPTVGLRFHHDWESGLYINSAAYDGVAGNPGGPTDSTQIKFNSGDGVLFLNEVGKAAVSGTNYKLAVGGWYQTHKFTDFSGTEQTSDHGAYVVGERDLFGGDADKRTLTGFARIGFADSSKNQIDYSVAIGVQFSRFIPGRGGDSFGVAIAQAHTGSDWRSFNAEAASAERSYELTYRAELLPGLVMQPNVQLITDPGFDTTRDDALVYGIRFAVAF